MWRWGLIGGMAGLGCELFSFLLFLFFSYFFLGVLSFLVRRLWLGVEEGRELLLSFAHVVRIRDL